MKRKISMLIGIIVVSALAVRMVSGDNTILRIEGERVTGEEIEFSRESQEKLAQTGIWDEKLSDEEIVEEYVRDILLEKQYERYEITLTPQEEAYARHYLADQEAVIQKSLQSENESVRKNAEEVLAAIEHYCTAMELTHSDYEEMVYHVIADSIKYSKLADQIYHGEKAELEASLKREAKVYLDSGAAGV